MQKNSQPSTKLELKHWLMLIPAILMLGITPLFIRYFPVQYPALPVTWKLEGYMVADLFTYGKQQLILVSGVLSLIFLFLHVGNIPFKNKKNSRPLVLIGATIAWLILTTFTASFPHAAIWGMIEKFEGVLVWLTYIVFALYIGSLVKLEAYRTGIFRIILFSGLAITGVGLSQFLSHDLVRMDWFKALIMPIDVAKSATFAFEANRVYSTLYNPNFVAMYVATLMPISLFMIYREKSVLFKGLWSLFSGLLVINLIGSKNSGGLVGILGSLAILAFVLILQKFSVKLQRILTISAVCTATIVLILFFSGAFNNLINLQKFTPPYNMSNISTNGFQTIIEYKGKKLIAAANPQTLDSVIFYNQDQVQLDVTSTPNPDGYYNIVSPDFSEVFFTTGVTENGMAFINFKIENVNWVFLLHPNGMMYVNSMSTTVPFELSKGSGGFVGHEGFGSARGFIWSRTLPLIAASPIVGYGADNFTVAFPQNDYNLKYQLYGNPNTLVDKAHNMLLQLTANFGIPGLILLLSVIGYSVRTLYRSYVSKEDADFRLNLALILCIFGYLGSGLFYDSNLHVSPFFWTFIGFGFKDLFKA